VIALFSHIQFGGERPLHICGHPLLIHMFHDAPEPGKALGAWSSSRDLFRTMVDHSCDWVYWLGPDGSYVYISPACEQITEYHPEEFIKNPRLMEEIVHPEDREAFARHIHEPPGKHSIDFRIITRGGEVRWISHSCQVAYDSEGSYLGRWASNRNITDRKRMEDALRRAKDDLEKRILDRTAEQLKANEALQREIVERKLAEEKEKASREFLDKIINSIGDPIHVKDRQHRIILVNDAACELFCLTREEILGKTAYELFPRKEMADISWEKDEEVFKTGVENTNTETNTYAPGITLTVLARKTLYTDNAGNKFLVGITVDITDRKLAEDKLIASLHEKEVLIKEVHHRVKNNLQVISSLLNLQGRQTEDEETREAFRDCRNRIRSMALVHEKLYGSKELARIDLADYVRNLTSYLSASYGIEKRVRLRLDLEDAAIGIDKAIPFGLIINELVTNCIKHAFPDGRTGEIRIDLHPCEGKLKLVLSDNGIGLSKKIDDPSTKSLGLNLVQTLVKQLKGTIDVQSSSNGGTKFILAFDM